MPEGKLDIVKPAKVKKRNTDIAPGHTDRTKGGCTQCDAERGHDGHLNLALVAAAHPGPTNEYGETINEEFDRVKTGVQGPEERMEGFTYA